MAVKVEFWTECGQEILLLLCGAKSWHFQVVLAKGGVGRFFPAPIVHEVLAPICSVLESRQALRPGFPNSTSGDGTRMIQRQLLYNPIMTYDYNMR